MIDVFKIIRTILTIAVLFVVCVLKNLSLGCVLVAIMCFCEVLEYKKTKKKAGVILVSILFLVCLIFTILY